jgi:hypothetical protein
MVHGLIKHFNLDLGVMNLRGQSDEFVFLGGNKVPTDDWNPLLIAIANKKTEIVRYFLDDLKVSLKNHGKNPADLIE